MSLSRKSIVSLLMLLICVSYVPYMECFDSLWKNIGQFRFFSYINVYSSPNTVLSAVRGVRVTSKPDSTSHSDNGRPKSGAQMRIARKKKNKGSHSSSTIDLEAVVKDMVALNHGNEALELLRGNKVTGSVNETHLTPSLILYGITTCNQLDLEGMIVATNELYRQAEANKIVTIPIALATLTNCRRSGDWRTALHVYQSMKQAVCAFNEYPDNGVMISSLSEIPSIIYGQTAITLARSGAETQTLQVVTDMLSAGEFPTTQTIDNIILDLSKRGAYQVIMNIFDQLKRYQQTATISKRAMNALLNACSKAKEYKICLLSYEKYMVDDLIQQSKLDSIGLSVLMKACDKLGLCEKATEIILSLRHTKLVSLSIVERVLAICVKSKSLKLALVILLEFEKDFWNANELSKSIFMDEFVVESDILHEILQIDHPVKASPRMYTAAITLLAETANAEKGLSLLKRFVERGGQEIEAMYTSLIYGLRLTMELDRAIDIFDMLKDRAKYVEGLELSIASYNSLISVFSQCHAFERNAGVYIDEMKQKGIKWDDRTYAAVMTGQNESQKTLELWNAYIEGIQTKERLNHAVIMEALKACQQQADGDGAVNVLKHVRRVVKQQKTKSDGRNIPDQAMYTQAIQALRADDKPQSHQVIKLFEDMASESTTPSMPIYRIAMDIFESETEWKEASKLLLQMFRLGLPVDSRTTNSAIHACIKAGQTLVAIRLMDGLPRLRKGLSLDDSMVVQVLSAALKMNDIAIVERLMNTFEGRGFNLPQKLVWKLITFFDTHHRHEWTVELFETYVTQHIDNPDLDSDSTNPLTMVVDLHGYSVAVAKAAVRAALQRLDYPLNLVIVTGRGVNTPRSSNLLLDPILKPVIASWLSSKEFTPPLIAAELSDNTGRLIVSSELIEEWIVRKRNTELETRSSRK